MTLLAAVRVPVVERKLYDSAARKERHLRGADVNVGNVGHCLSVAIVNVNVDQAVDIEAGLLELLLLEGRIEAVVEHWLGTADASGAGGPEAVGMKGVHGVGGEGNVEVLHGNRCGFNICQETIIASIIVIEERKSIGEGTHNRGRCSRP